MLYQDITVLALPVPLFRDLQQEENRNQAG